MLRFSPAHAAIVVLAAAFWLLNHQYGGIQRDAVVYAVLAARWLDPMPYAKELFFAFGSQDDFSLFSPLYGSLIEQVGLDAAARSIVLMGAAMWILACLVLARVLFEKVWMIALAVLLCATVSFSYAPNFSTFTLNESVATARSLALPLAVLSLAAWLHGRRIVAVAMSIMAIALHPLLGIWVPLLWLACALPNKVLFTSVALAACLLPFLPLPLMDGEWIATVAASTKDVIPGDWDTLRWREMVLTIGLLWLAGKHGSTRQRLLFTRLALLTPLALLLAKLCGDFYPIRLVIQGQAWRVLWLSEFMAIFAVVSLLGVAADAGRRYFVIALALLATAWGVPLIRPFLPYALLVALGQPAVAGLLQQVLAALAARPTASWVLGIGLLLALLPNYWLSLELLAPAVAMDAFSAAPALKGFLLSGGEGLFLLALALALQQRQGAVIIIFAGLPCLWLAASHWDTRDEARRDLERSYLTQQPPQWRHDLPLREGDTVLWQGRGLATWLVMRTSAYAANEQVAGIVFSRERMVEVRRRLERVTLASASAADGDLRNLQKIGQGEIRADGIALLCEDASLDWVISGWPNAGGMQGIRFDPGVAHGGAHYLFECRALRTHQQVSGNQA